jgi:Holliday junction resolvase RusA-like endonuclease
MGNYKGDRFNGENYFDSTAYEAIKDADKTFTYYIDDIPPSNNKFIGRTNVREYQEEKQKWAWIVKAATMKKKPSKPLTGVRVILTYFFKDDIDRDPDNYSGKFILDGLKHAGIIKDDNFKVIKLELDGKFKCGKKQTMIEIKPRREDEE